MSDLVFFTDRYPYNNSEAFIENEIDIISSQFDRVFILPCGLMVDTITCRKVPQNVRIIPPPVQDDIWASRPSRLKKVFWGISHLFPWFVMCLFTKQFYKELGNMKPKIGISPRGIIKVFRVLGPAIRNRNYYRHKYGYGGKCFPKDVNAFAKMTEGTPLGTLLEHLHELNVHFRGVEEHI